MFSRRNLILLIVVLAAAGTGAYYYVRQRQTAAEQAAQAALRTETISRGTLQSIVSATGSLVPEQQINLFFGTAQALPVVEVSAELGQSVKKGDVLARLDTTDLELAVTDAEQALQAAQLALDLLLAPPRPADVAVAEANLRLARSQVYAASQGPTEDQVQIAYLNLRLAQNALDQTHRTMDNLVARNQYAQKQALESQEAQQIEAARVADLRYQQVQQQAPKYGPIASGLAGMEQAQVSLDRLEGGARAEDLKIARLRLEQAQTALQLARNNLADARLIAPFDGLLAAVNLQLGGLVSSALPAATLVDLSHFHLDVAVDEVDVARVAVGQPVTLTLDALPDEQFAGQVEKIAPTSSVNQGVVSFLVRVVLASGSPRLRGGMTATADIVVDEARDVVLVPNWAIRRDRDTGQAYVGVLRGGQIQDVAVELGLRNDTFSQVLSGVAAGETAAVQTTREQFDFFGGGQ